MSLRKNRLTQLRNRSNTKKSRPRSGIELSPPDTPLILIVSALVLFGTMFIFSAGAPEGSMTFHNPAYFAIRHIIFLILGTFLMVRFAKYDYKRFHSLAIPMTVFTIFLIGLTYTPLGKADYGSARWLNLFGVPFQPSELAKLTAIMLVSTALIDAKTIFYDKLIIRLGIIGVMLILILHQPNLSMFIMITFTTAALLLVGGVSDTLIGVSGILGFVFIGFHIKSNEYQFNRIKGWLHPWHYPQSLGYNLIQSWYAIGSGGLYGVGFGHSKQKLFWLPFRHTDFIFAVIAEELGFVGCLILILLFLAFIQRGIVIANRCSDPFGKLIAFGITFSIGLQAFINIGVATGVFPVTGVTLPLISYGGSSVIVTMMMIGILLNISRKRIRRIEPVEA